MRMLNAVTQILPKVAVLIALVLVAPANATFITQDWHSGDGLVVLDTETGLQWLKPSVTQGLSILEVHAQLGEGGTYEGWRWANHLEYRGLLIDAGLPTYDTIFYYPQFYAPALDFLNIFGPTLGSIGSGSASIAASYGSGGYEPLPLGESNFQVIGISNERGIARNDSYVSNASHNSNRGAWLIQDVPEPSTLALLALGLAGLGFARRRKV